jgi:hypothetical protein
VSERQRQRERKREKETERDKKILPKAWVSLEKLNGEKKTQLEPETDRVYFILLYYVCYLYFIFKAVPRPLKNGN